MTDFHKLFMVKINKMIKMKTLGVFLVVYVIYGNLVYADSYRAVCVHFIMSLTIRIGLYFCLFGPI